MTRADLRTRILEALNDSATSPVFWSSAQMNDVIQDALEVIAEEVHGIKRTAITALRPGSTYYATRGIAQDLMVPTRLWVPSLNRRLTAVTVNELDSFHERWLTVSGDPEYWFPMGWDWFGVFPHPASGGGTLRVDYLAWPRPLMDDSDEPEFLLADHDAVVLYGIYDGLLKRWDVNQAIVILARFMELFGKAKTRSGLRRLQARQWQAGQQPGVTFRSGVMGQRDA